LREPIISNTADQWTKITHFVGNLAILVGRDIVHGRQVLGILILR